MARRIPSNNVKSTTTGISLSSRCVGFFSSFTYCADHWKQLHTPEQATAALELDGVVLDGASLRVRRPKDYAGIDPLLQTFNGIVAPSVADSPNKLFIGGIPTYLNDEQVMELLKSFGELKSFNLVKESAGVSKVSISQL